MRGAALVHVHLEVGPAAHQRPGRAGVVEVDVGEQQRPRRVVTERFHQGLHRRLRPRIDEHVADLPAADHPLAAEVTDVDGLHVHAGADSLRRASESDP